MNYTDADYLRWDPFDGERDVDIRAKGTRGDTVNIYECPYCGGVQPSANRTGSDVECCGERGHALRVEYVDDGGPSYPEWTRTLTLPALDGRARGKER